MELASSLPGRIAQVCQGALEQCGLLTAHGSSQRICDFVLYPGPLSVDRFELEPDWLLQEFYRQRAAAQTIVGYFHSHPRGASLEPSPADRRGHPPGSLVLIVSGDRWRLYRSSWTGQRWSVLFEHAAAGNFRD